MIWHSSCFIWLMPNKIRSRVLDESSIKLHTKWKENWMGCISGCIGCWSLSCVWHPTPHQMRHSKFCFNNIFGCIVILLSSRAPNLWLKMLVGVIISRLSVKFYSQQRYVKKNKMVNVLLRDGNLSLEPVLAALASLPSCDQLPRSSGFLKRYSGPFPNIR